MLRFLLILILVVSAFAGTCPNPPRPSLSSAVPADVCIPRSRDYDLREREAIRRLMKDARPDVVIHLAAVVGGIEANRLNPGRFLFDNAMMGLQLMEESRLFGVGKFVGDQPPAFGRARAVLPGAEYQLVAKRVSTRPERACAGIGAWAGMYAHCPELLAEAGLRKAPDRLVEFLRHPRQLRPGTPMPEMGVGVTDGDAWDIAAYLYTLKEGAVRGFDSSRRSLPSLSRWL